MGIENYETLLHCKINLNQTGIGWTAPLLSANFGAGYEVGVVTAPYGLHRWTLQANVLPQLEDYTVEYALDTNTFTATRFKYFFDFFKRHLLLGNKPFVIRDADNSKRYLVSFSEPGIDFERIAYQLFSGGVTVNERRVRDIAFNDDGSIVDENTPFITFFAVNAISDTVIRLNMAADDMDAVSGYDLEFTDDPTSDPQAAPGTDGWESILDDATPIAVYDHTGRAQTTRYYYRFRARDNDENVSPWVFGNDITGATADVTAPTMTSLVATPQTDPTKISIAYLGSDNQTIPANLRYDLQWSLTGTGGWTNLRMKQTSASPHIHTMLTPDTEYFYRARVHDEADNFSDWMATDATTAADTIAPVVSSFIATGGALQITLNAVFSDQIGVTGVDLDWSANGASGWTSLLSNAAPTTATTRTYTDSPLTAGLQRFYRFRARDLAGNWSGYSTANAWTNDENAPSVPTGLAVNGLPTLTTIPLQWNAAPDTPTGFATGYEIQYATNAGFTTGVGTKTFGAVTTGTLTGLVSGTTYFIRIRARDVVPNWSAYSTAIEVPTATTGTGGGLMQGGIGLTEDGIGLIEE